MHTNAWDDVRIPTLVVLVAGLAAGCGSGEYNTRFRETLKSTGAASETLQLVYGEPSDFVDAQGQPTGIRFQLPQFIGADAKALQAAGDGSERAQPPFLTLPGFTYAYEVQLADDAGNKSPAYAHFAAPAASEKSADQLATEIAAALQPKFPGSAWENATLTSFTGGSVAVKRLVVVGPQQFGGQTLDGRFELYLYPGTSVHALIGWRAPSAVAETARFFEAVQAAMGTLTGGA